jgi:hypothetical protein
MTMLASFILIPDRPLHSWNMWRTEPDVRQQRAKAWNVLLLNKLFFIAFYLCIVQIKVIFTYNEWLHKGVLGLFNTYILYLKVTALSLIHTLCTSLQHIPSVLCLLCRRQSPLPLSSRSQVTPTLLTAVSRLQDRISPVLWIRGLQWFTRQHTSHHLPSRKGCLATRKYDRDKFMW